MELKKYREAKGLSQSRLSRIIGVSSQTICMYESGVRTPKAEILKKLAKALDCTVDELLADI